MAAAKKATKAKTPKGALPTSSQRDEFRAAIARLAKAATYLSDPSRKRRGAADEDHDDLRSLFHHVYDVTIHFSSLDPSYADLAHVLRALYYVVRLDETAVLRDGSGKRAQKRDAPIAWAKSYMERVAPREHLEGSKLRDAFLAFVQAEPKDAQRDAGWIAMHGGLHGFWSAELPARLSAFLEEHPHADAEDIAVYVMKRAGIRKPVEHLDKRAKR